MAIEFKQPLPAAQPVPALKQRRLLPAKAGLAAGPPVALVVLLCTEWIHRGQLDAAFWQQYLAPNAGAYILAWLFLLGVYYCVYGLTRLAPLAVAFTGCLGCIPAAVTYFKLKLRGEPFFPWDISQGREAAQVVGKAGLKIQPSMVWVLAIFLALTAAACFIRRPAWKKKSRAAAILAPAGATALLIFGVFLQPGVTQALGIVPDMWMQDRYYRNNGVITGFLTNLQVLKISEPEGYSKEGIEQLARQIQNGKPAAPLYDDSYAARGNGEVQQPNIIFIMDESYWDVSRLPGVVFSEDVSANLRRLAGQAAYGRAYSPSFGGGTCDVEFEALTGYSMEFLPSGSKPFQQHVTRQMFSLPNFLKEQGYQTQAVHGYYKRFWNRDKAYPRLGIDRFIGLDDMLSPEKKRGVEWPGGLVTDDEMASQIIRLYEGRQVGQPLFLHAVTMQNHTSYHAENYPDGERVRVLQAPEGMSQETLGALEDFATGVRDADAMLGRLTEYFSQVDEPVILVFWGDHYNPIGSGYEVYTATGYASGGSSDPALHQMDLLIWSNYWQQPVQLGTVAAYQISPVMMELYGLQKPLFFEYLTQQLAVYRSRTLGVTVQPDGTAVSQAVEEMGQDQQQWFANHWMLQYDLMFGREYLLQ